ncbi:kinase-like protein [Wallemia mellicola]|uniref:Translation initiation factor eIF2B subunit delta n=1 Tax=Wallemia mellicola TaxID=1708541 RepID=A0AB38N0G8_9BASI|nr:kinase-like protein [Wallemia mellicola]
MEGLEEIQSNELEALSAIYGDLFQLKKQLKTAWQGAASLPEYMIKLEPLEDDLKAYVSIELHVKIPKTYPNVPPQLSIRNTRGLSVSQRDDLTKQVIKKSRDSDLIGQPMLYDLAIFCQEYISTNHTIIGNASLATRMQERLNAVQAEKIQREESYEAKKRHKQSLEADALAQRIEADIKRKEEQIKSEADKQNTQLSRQRQYKSHDVWTETFDNNTTVHVGNHISSDGLSSIYLCSVANSDELLELEVFLINSDYYDKSAGKRKLQDVARILDKLSKLKSDHIEHIHASKLRPHPQASGTIVWELLILHSRTSGMSTLSDLLQACDNFRVDLATSYLTQILVGLQELHKLDVVHMDISPSNILILPGKTLTIIRPSYAKTILNLHRSNPINERKISEIFVNEGWQAPECLETQQFSRKRDIWDTGVCFINMLFGLDAMSYPSPKVLLDKSGDVPQHTLDIISYMLESNPSQRGSAVQLLDKLYNSSDNSSSVATTRPKSSALYHNSSTPKPPATPSMSVKAAPPIDPFWQSTNQQSNTSRFRSDFEEVEHLGKGGFGEVVKARNRLDGLFYAIKKVRLKSNTDSKLFREVLSLSRLNSRYVVRYFGCWIEEAAQTVSQSFAEKDVNTKKAGTSDSYSFSMHKLLNPKFDDSLSVAKTASRDDGIFFEADSDEDTENGEEDEEEEEEEEEEIESESGTSSSDSDSELSTNQDTRHNRNFNHSRILYIQMQYCEKLTLSEALEEGLSVDERWKIFRQILDGLAYINTLGIVHRDLKPSNVFIDAQGDVKIGDFGLATLGVNDPNYSTVFDKALVNQSNDTTSAVGTSLYIAPEIANSSGRYTEKVDMFSLGVGMERVQVLHQMRQPKPRFPATFPDNLTTERKLIEWMLKHDQSERPSAAEVLHSSLLPETMEEEYFEEALRVLHPDQPRYQKLVSRLFNNSPNALQYHTYDTGGGPLSPDAIIRLVQEHLGWVFRLHGAVPLEPPLLSPKPDNSDKTKEKDVVSLLDSTGCVVHLPHNGLLGFARMILKQNIVRTKRFWMGGRFKRNVAGGQPIKESEANFDIVSPTTTKAMEGEIMSVVNKTLELPFLKTSNWEVRINHSIIIEIILSLFPHKKRSVVLGIFDQLGKGVSMPHIRSQLASQVDNSRSVTRLEELDHLLLKGNDYKTILNDMMKVLPHYKEQLKETLEELNNTFEYFARNHNRRNIIFDTTTMLNNSYEDYATGLVLDISRRVAKGRREVMAIGGRSDNLLERLSHTTRSLPYMVGLRINADVVANCLMESSNKKTPSKAMSSYKSYMPRRCDVYVGSFGNAYNGMMSERMDVASTLWDAGISADVMYDGAHAYQSPDMLMERCRGEGITYLVLLKANSTVMKVRNTLSKKSEEEVDRHDLVDYLSRKLSELRQTQEETARVHEKDAPGVDIHLAMPSEIAWSFKKDDNKNRINKRNRALMSDRAENALQEYENDGEIAKIASSLGYKDILQLSLTCKRLERLLRQYLSLKITIRGHDLSTLKELRCRASKFKHITTLDIDLRICLYKPSSLAKEVARGMRQLPSLHHVSLAWDQPIYDSIAESLSNIPTISSLHLVFYDTLLLGLSGRRFTKSKLKNCKIEWYPRDAKYGDEPDEDGDPQPLPPPSNSEFNDLFSFIAQFGSTLEELSLGPLPFPSDVIDKDIETSYNSMFKSLKELTILTIAGVERSYLICINDNDDMFKRLKSLKFADRPPSTRDNILRVPKQLKELELVGLLEPDELAYALIDLRDKQLEKLKLSIIITEDDSLERLCYSIPTIKELDIALVFGDAEDVPLKYWPDKVINMLSKMPFLEKITIHLNLDELYGDPSPLAIPNTEKWREWDRRSFKKKMSEAKQKKINQKSERRKQKVEARGGGERPEHTQQASQHHGSVKSDGGSVVNSTAPVATTASPFKHLHKSPNTIVKPENVHPQISRLGSLLSNFSIVGANARTLALMSGLKLVIGSYNTPAGTTLSRNLLSVISPQISHLESCRPKSLSNGSAIRWLKLQIVNIDPDMDDNDARNHLCMLIDCYVRDRITLADDEIVKNTLSKLSSTVQTTILVYARSSIVEKTLIEAKKAGKMLSVIIVDSKPLNEGKNLLTRLTDMGVECTYAHLSALPSLLPNINMTLLGAHAILANGALYSRVGNASVALLSKVHNVPVYALAESYKFVDRMMLDSITTNEISPPDLFELDVNGLGQNVRQESLLYDVTPPKLLEAIISEVGIHPPSSVSGLMFRARA